jgi:hypothetical protein
MFLNTVISAMQHPGTRYKHAETRIGFYHDLRGKKQAFCRALRKTVTYYQKQQ